MNFAVELLYRKFKRWEKNKKFSNGTDICSVWIWMLGDCDGNCWSKQSSLMRQKLISEKLSSVWPLSCSNPVEIYWKRKRSDLSIKSSKQTPLWNVHNPHMIAFVDGAELQSSWINITFAMSSLPSKGNIWCRLLIFNGGFVWRKPLSGEGRNVKKPLNISKLTLDSQMLTFLFERLHNLPLYPTPIAYANEIQNILYANFLLLKINEFFLPVRLSFGRHNLRHPTHHQTNEATTKEEKFPFWIIKILIMAQSDYTTLFTW